MRPSPDSCAEPFYRDWRALIGESDRGFTSLSVPAAPNVTAFRLGQLIGRHPEFIDVPRFDPYSILAADEDLFRKGLYHLETEARPAVVAALKAHFGGTSGLFVALWNSDKQPRPKDYDWNWEEHNRQRDWDIQNLHTWEPAYQNTEGEILMNETAEKLHLWTWLDQGAGPLRRY